MIALLIVVAVGELLFIVALVRGKRTATAELERAQDELYELKRDDGRFVDQLLERGRQEIQQVEAYYRRNLPERQQPSGDERS